MHKDYMRVAFSALCILSFVLAFPFTSAIADHELGHDEVARGGVKALEERIWDLEQRVLSLSQKPSVKSVDCDGGQSLQAALDAGVDGDRFNVIGTCNEHVTVRLDRVTIEGGGLAQLVGANSALAVVQIRASQVIFRGFTVSGGQDGIAVEGTRVRILQNAVTGAALNGIRLRLGAGATIEDNTVTNAAGTGIEVTLGSGAQIQRNAVTGAAGHGIRLRLGVGATIEDNTVTNAAQNGIEVTLGSGAQIQRNEVKSNGNNGINLVSGAGAIIRDNTVMNNGFDGISLNRAAGALIAGNTSSNNVNDGIGVRGASSAWIESNTLQNNGDDGIGLFVGGVADLEAGNLIEGNREAGVLCIDSSIYIRAVQNFGSGNIGPNTIIDSDCRVQNRYPGF